MIPHKVLTELLMDEFHEQQVGSGYGLEREYAEAVADRILAKAYHQAHADGTRDAVLLQAAMQVLEDFMRRDMRNEVQIGHYYVLLDGPGFSTPLRILSDKSERRLPDALVKAAQRICSL